MRSFSHYGTRIATVDAVVLVGDVQTRDRANVHSSRYGVATVQRLIAFVVMWAPRCCIKTIIEDCCGLRWCTCGRRRYVSPSLSNEQYNLVQTCRKRLSLCNWIYPSPSSRQSRWASCGMPHIHYFCSTPLETRRKRFN